MLLRRITKHVKDQNWFTVAVETLIVVLGVFLGLQVNNWNADNNEKASERQLLSRVKTDVEAAVTTKTKWLGEMRAHRKSLISAVDVVQNRPEQQTLSDAHCRAMWTSHLLIYPVAPLGSLDELLSTGRLRTNTGQAVAPVVLAYRDNHEVIIQLNSSLRDLANLGDTYSNAFPRRVISTPVTESTVDAPRSERADRVTDSAFQTECELNLIRADQTIQNKLLSNLARTDGLMQRVEVELSALEKIKIAMRSTT